MFRRRYIVWSHAVALGALVLAASGNAQRPTSKQLDRIARSYVDSGFTGVVLVAVNDTVLLREAYQSDTVMVNKTIGFWVASMTKGFTAAAVLQLIDDKKISLGDSLGRFFPDIPADKRGITVGQLLTHTSGLNGPLSGGAVYSRSSAVRAIAAHKLETPPGAMFHFNDDNYQLLAAVIEVVRQGSWKEYVEDAFLKPIGLRRTGFSCERYRDKWPIAAASGYSTCYNSTTIGDGLDWANRGADGMWSNVDDLFRWSRALQPGGRLASIGAMMATPRVVVDSQPDGQLAYGYGVRIDMRGGQVVDVIHAGAGDDSHTSMILQCASGLTAIVLSNAGDHKGTTWASFLAHKLVTCP